jgi:tRNA modification GTPase
MDRSTIAAIATPIGGAGIGIIKISGPHATAIAAAIFVKSEKTSDIPGKSFGLSPEVFQSHHLYHGHIRDPRNGRVLDEVLLSVMRAPHSYTCEDVVEINTHSGTVVLRAIMHLVLSKGARLAEPGEFTRRAFVNGRIDLTQAEAVIDIINARTEKALEIAATHLKGEFKDCVVTIRDALLDILTLAEAAIDFPEDVDPQQADSVIDTLRQLVILPLTDLVNQYLNAHVLRDGLTLAVVGRPNVGKSSLMNRLIQKDRVIVSPYPGTTRDFVEETLNIHGIPVIIADTAGLHDTKDPVEVIGIQKTREYIQGCDLVLFIIDASEPLNAEDHQIYDTIKGKNVVLVLNKQDLLITDAAVCLPDTWQDLPRVIISALYNQGLDRLKDLIASVSIGDIQLDTRSKMIPNLRHNQLLEQSLHAANTAAEGLQSGTPFELVAIDLQEAVNALGNIIGVTVKPDILDQIFSRFCIGK